MRSFAAILRRLRFSIRILRPRLSSSSHRWALRTGIALVLCTGTAAEPPAPEGGLARSLAEEAHYEEAALEYRRLALAEPDPARRGGYYWAAAYAYLRAQDPERAQAMLDRAEDDAPELATPAMLLRAETTQAAGQQEESAFYLESVLAGSPDGQTQRYVRQLLAATHLRLHEPVKARALLANADWDADSARAAIDAYQRGRDKKPRLGALLGAVPGLGYVYAGEYANGLRSLILNGLFIYGMANTANKEQWGAFSVITFFEFTWYTGSIYGGIDASHRYNRERRQRCIKAVHAGAAFEPDLEAVPAVVLRFSF